MPPAHGGNLRAGFTLLEMLVAFVLLAIIVVVVFSITQQAGKAWQNSQARIESFQGARAAFEAMTRRLSQTTLNNYYGYYPDSVSPTRYVRRSELHFVSGKSLLSNPSQVTHAVFFQAPLGYTDDTAYVGLDNLLNACGYYVEYNNDTSRPGFLSSLPDRYRYRLMQFSQPTQNLSVYDSVSGNAWFTGPLSGTASPTRQMAENVVALVIRPKLSSGDEAAQGGAPLSPDYEYDTRASGNAATENQLPPLLEIVMVAIDEPSAIKLGNTSGAPDLGQGSLFQDAEKLEDDLRDLERVLNAEAGNIAGNTTKLAYRIFRTEVPLQASKWSSHD